jgi:hypothetical protein
VHRLLRITVVLGWLMLAVALSPVANAATNQIRTPVDTFIFSQCTGEAIHIEGTVHTTVKVTQNQDGSTTIRFHFNYQGVQGTGVDTGRKYVVNSAGKQQQHVESADTFELSGMDKFKLIAQGSSTPADDLDVRSRFRLRLENGVVVENTFDFEFECK